MSLHRKNPMIDEVIGWYHQLNGHESEKTPGDGEGQGSLACCSPWGCKESDTTEQLHNIIQVDLFGFPCGSAGKKKKKKKSTCNVGVLGLIPGLGRSPGEGKGYPLQYSGLENSMDQSMGSQSQTWLSDFHFYTPRTECEPAQKVREPQNMAWLVFVGWVIS